MRKNMDEMGFALNEALSKNERDLDFVITFPLMMKLL